jgi:hypothetical protein
VLEEVGVSSILLSTAPKGGLVTNRRFRIKVGPTTSQSRANGWVTAPASGRYVHAMLGRRVGREGLQLTPSRL